MRQPTIECHVGHDAGAIEKSGLRGDHQKPALREQRKNDEPLSEAQSFD